MNLVDQIKGQLTGDVLGKLSGLVGASPEQTKTAVNAGVPALLSGLAGMAESGGGGLSKLAGVLGGIDKGATGNIANALSSGAGGLAEKGKDMLGSLFGGSTLSSLAGAIGKFTGLGEGVISKILNYVAPIVMGSVANAWQSRGGGTQALAGLLSEQKSNIKAAMPSGLSLASVPGLGSVATAAKDASSGLANWILPVLAMLLLGAGLIYLFTRKTEPPAPTTSSSPGPIPSPALPTKLAPSTPDVTTLTSDIQSVFRGATETLGSVKDAETATAALPKLTELNGKLDTIKGLWSGLPDTAKSTLGKLIKDNIDPLKALISKATAIPGVGEKLKPVVDGLLEKLTVLAG